MLNAFENCITFTVLQELFHNKQIATFFFFFNVKERRIGSEGDDFQLFPVHLYPPGTLCFYHSAISGSSVS